MTTKRINSASFSGQLRAAGLLGLPFAWGEDGVIEFPTKLVPRVITEEVTEELTEEVGGEAVTRTVTQTVTRTVFDEAPDLERMSQAQRDAVLALYAEHDPDAPVVPRVVSRRQARQAMLAAGISFAAVQQAIDNISDPQQRAMMQVEWDDSQEFHRDRPQLIALAVAMGLTAAQVDALFIDADKR